MRDKELTKLREWYKKYSGEDSDVILDFEAEVDTNISFEENQEILKYKIDELIGEKQTLADLKAEQLKQKVEEQKYIEKYVRYREKEAKDNWIKVVKTCKSICIVGETGTGKTAMGFFVMDLFKKYTAKTIYAFKFPKPELLKQRGIKIMYSIEELSEIENAVIYLTEPQLTIPKYDKRNNDNLQKVLSLARQRNLTIIIDTSDTGYINRGLESYINVWCVKDMAYNLIKQGSIIRYIIKENAIIDPFQFRLKVNEYLFYSREFYKFKGRFTFTKPYYFTDKFSRMFSNCE